MKTKSILISLSSMLLLTCGTAKNNSKLPSTNSVLEEIVVTKQDIILEENLANEESVDSATIITYIDSTLLINPWIIIPPPYDPWEIIIPSPYPFEWPWVLTSSVYYAANSRPEDDNDRVYNHLIIDQNCYQLQKVESSLTLDLDISEETKMSCSIEGISNKASTINTAPNWLNAPINIPAGQHNFSIPFLEDLSMDFKIELNTEGENQNYLLRI